jgi:hypothetical protein
LSTVFDNVRQAGAVIPLDMRYGDRSGNQPEGHSLDSEPYKARLSTLMEWWAECRDYHSLNRYEQAIDSDFYDGIQWRDDDVQTLLERGQAAHVFNVIAQHINWLLGTERRTRVDFRVYSRDGNDEPGARIKTAALKYVHDVNKAQFHRSAAFADAVKVGVGWLEDGVRGDPFDEPIFSRRESWRNMWWDPLAVEPDLSDARYIFRVRWADTDVVKVMFKNRAAAVEASSRSDDLLHFEDDSEMIGYTGMYGQPTDRTTIATGHSVMDYTFSIGSRRKRNKLIECWYRMPAEVQVIRPNPVSIMSQQFQEDLLQTRGMEFDQADPMMQQLVDQGYASVYDAVKMKVRCAIWCGNYLLQDVESPYRHDRFPFTPIWGYRRDRDGLPYGAIRNMRDPQEDLNKRRSKALFLISANQLIADDDAFEDWDEAADEVARPDGILKKRRGADVEIQRNIELAEAHADLMREDVNFLQAASGVTEENRGEVTNTNSGAAIDMRQRQGSVVTAVLFDNLRHAIQLQGEQQLALIEQFMAEPKVIMISNRRGAATYSRVNYPQVLPDGTLDVENPITANQALFHVDEQAFKETARAAMYEQAYNSLQTLDPQHQLQLLDLVYELSDIPNKDEWVRRIRRLNKQVDPDDPARDQKEAMLDQSDRANAEQQSRLVEADIAQKMGTGRKALAGAGQSRAETMAKAAEIMAMLAAQPELAKAVDILTDAFQKEDASPAPEASMAVAVGPDEPVAAPAGESSAGSTGTSPTSGGGGSEPPGTKKRSPGAPPPKPKQPTPGSKRAAAKNYAGR